MFGACWLSLLFDFMVPSRGTMVASDPPMPLVGATTSGSPEAAEAWAEELASELADRLESWAIEREKILAKLDIRSAKAARALSRSLRIVARALAASASLPSDPERKAVVARLVMLRRDALRLMSSGANASSHAEFLALEKLAQGEIPNGEDRPTLAPPEPMIAQLPDPTRSDEAGAENAHSRKTAPPQPHSSQVRSAEPRSLQGHSTLPPKSSSDQPTGSRNLISSHSAHFLQSSQPPGTRPSDTAAGGLGDYIARIRRLKGG